MGARVFDGSDDYLELDSAPVTGVPFTIAAWVKVDTHSTDGTVVGLFDKDSGQEWFFVGADSSGDVQVEHRSGGSGATQNVRTTATLTTGAWESYAAVFAALDDRRVFLNGSNKGSSTGAEAAPPVDRLSVGRMGDSTPGNYHDGKIQYVFIWNVALSDAEVADFHAGNIPQQANLVEWWEFDGSSPEVGKISGTQLTVNGATFDSGDSPPVTYGGGGSTDRVAEVSFTEFEVPTAPRNARVSLVELEAPESPREARVAFAELEVPTAPRTGRVSWAEFEVGPGARSAGVSFVALEVPDAPRLGRVSLAEFEVPSVGQRAAIVSFAELEVPTAPRQGRVSWASLEAPNAPRAALVSWAAFSTQEWNPEGLTHMYEKLERELAYHGIQLNSGRVSAQQLSHDQVQTVIRIAWSIGFKVRFNNDAIEFGAGD